MYQPTFFVTSVGQIELRGPLSVNITLSVDITVPNGQMPRLIFWNNGMKTNNNITKCIHAKSL